jgi:PAS domain S-box-containing protein
VSPSRERRFAPRPALERRLNLTVILPVAMSLLFAVALVAEMLLLLDSAAWVDATDRAIAQAREIEGLLVHRDLTADPAADHEFDRALTELGTLVVNLEQQSRLRRIVAEVAGSRQLPERHQAIERATRQLAEFVTVAEGLRRERSQRSRQLARALVGVTLAAAVMLGGILGLFARRQLHAVAADYEDALVHARAQTLLLSEEEKFRRLIEAVDDYAIFLLDPQGNVSSWNAGAERGTGWRAEEVIGRSFAVFFTPEDRDAGKPQRELEAAAKSGGARGEDQRLRKDGSRFVAEVTLTAVRDPSGELAGFASIARDVSQRRRNEAAIGKLNRDLADRVAELAAANDELEAFSYSVSHDLRGPLRAIDGFSKILMEQYRDRLDQQGQHYLARVRAGSQRMGQLIDDLLGLARINRSEMNRSDVDLAQLARDTVEELRRRDPDRRVEVVISERAPAHGDSRLLRAALENLLGNAWKFTSRTADPKIELGWEKRDGIATYYVRDNGAGFDMAYAHKLFAPFQRLHQQSEFEGTGVGLATVRRIITRHGGKLWAESTPGRGATFWFTLGAT